MALYGILKGTDPHNDNTGLDNELSSVFSAPLSIESNQTSYISDTITLRRCSKKNYPQRWEIETSISRVEPSTNFLVKSVVCGNTDPFYIRMPQLPETFRFMENIATQATTSFTASSINLSVGADALSGLTIPVGMFVKFSGHSKVYLIKAASSIGSVNNIEIFPNLKKNVAQGERMYYGARVSMTAVFDAASKLGISFDDGILSNVTNIKIVEYF